VNLAGKVPCFARQPASPANERDPGLRYEVSIYLWVGTFAPAQPVAQLGSVSGTPVGVPVSRSDAVSKSSSARVAQVRATRYVQACLKSRQYIITAIRRQRLDRAPGGIGAPRTEVFSLWIGAPPLFEGYLYCGIVKGKSLVGGFKREPVNVRINTTRRLYLEKISLSNYYHAPLPHQKSFNIKCN
jgi:hypothetical protein